MVWTWKRGIKEIIVGSLWARYLNPRGQSTEFYTGRLSREVQPFTLSHANFDRKGIPFVYLLLIMTNSSSFTYLVESLLTAVNAPCFYYKNKSLNQQFFLSFYFSQPWNSLVDSLGPFKDRNYTFPYPFIYFNKWNPYSFIKLKSQKGTPFGWSLHLLLITMSTPWD